MDLRPRFRLWGRWRSLPVLFMSGYERPPFADGTRTDFLQKPFRLEALREKVGALLGMEPPSEG